MSESIGTDWRAFKDAACPFPTQPSLSIPNRVLSVRCETLSTWRTDHQSSMTSADERLPLRQGGGAAKLEGLAIDEVTFRVEVVVQAGVDRSELLEGLHPPEALHRPLSSPEWQV